MPSIIDFMTRKHRECDDVFSEAESAVAKSNWTLASQQWHTFADELELHLQAEETILFPQFEQATGMTNGPTQVMRMEHQQMRALIQDLNTTLTAENKKDFLANSETLMVLMQQHNMKEEMMLYPMTEQHLSNSEDVCVQLQQHCLTESKV
ncbi:MAG: hemerythrin HHE cation-binding protein [Gammaproteobacteria bacterium]|nr:MAG: hemerythrin HHE cation-binding protein [Gammaproteobacteria bacterium]